MKAVFVGYSKCGTKTMNAVFKSLGYNCYDFEENAFYLYDEWMKILRYGATAEDFKRMYKDVDAAVETPVYNFWEEILEAFPDVKLIMAYKDEQAWMKSLQKQASSSAGFTFNIMTLLSPSCYRFAKLARLAGFHSLNCNWDAYLPWTLAKSVNPSLALKRYKQHNLFVKQNAPKDQLHVVDFSKGWEPICAFLGEPVPDKPFPHANKMAEIIREYVDRSPLFAQMKKEALISLSLLIVLFAFFVYFVLV